MTVEIEAIIALPDRTVRQGDLARLVRHLKAGGFAVLPTDTGPMLACDALNARAVGRVFDLKGRSERNPMHVALPDMSHAPRYIHAPLAARRVMAGLLPGPLTVVCRKTDLVSDGLVAGTGHLGVRVPGCPTTLQVCAAFGGPLTATSLNLSGRPALATVEDNLRALHFETGETAYALFDPHQAVAARPSTVVRILSDDGCEILRQGPVSAADIEAAMHDPAFDDLFDPRTA